jgi:hypothetical protein
MKLLEMIALVAVVLLTSCSKVEDQAVYDLHIGEKALKMAIKPNDIRGMEAMAVKEIMVLWDNLDEGKSDWFSYSVTRPWNDAQGDLDGAVAAQTTGSGKWRFFKHVSGEYGIENESNPIATSTNLNREGIAEIVRINLNEFEPILRKQ